MPRGRVPASPPAPSWPGPLAELDGTPAMDFFTVLSVGARYSEEQWLNVLGFSMLRPWLLRHGSGGARATTGRRFPWYPPPRPSSRQLPPRSGSGRRRWSTACGWRSRVTGRRCAGATPGGANGRVWPRPVALLDVICKQDVSYCTGRCPCSRTCPGGSAPTPPWPPRCCPSPSSSSATVRWPAPAPKPCTDIYWPRCRPSCTTSRSLPSSLCASVGPTARCWQRTWGAFRGSFPGLLKFLAWNGPMLVAEFVALLPALINPTSALDLFHSLLDLPCVTAALEMQRSCPLGSDKAALDHSLLPPSAAEAFRHPQCREVFQYILRSETCPVPEQLSLLHRALADLSGSPRVAQCAEIVPCLLRQYFTIVATVADGPLIGRLVLAVLERSGRLYDPPKYKEEVHRVLSAQLPRLFRLHPALVVELSRELLDFVGTTSNIESKEPLFTHVVWAVGEFVSVSYDRRCTVEQVNRFFDVLETLLFEITQTRGSCGAPKSSPRLITTLMTTLTKLASRSQDLIPKVSLYLSKMRSCVQSAAMISAYGEEESEQICVRATELMNLLKVPSVAQFALTPSPDVRSPAYHRDVASSLPLAIRASSCLLHKGGTSVPG
uniref:Adaptor related protein complex 5 subunit zeta 1 n=1 Tax=Xenopus tropicalis TaxID=8364 RepID=A0A803J7A1_XENTR